MGVAAAKPKYYDYWPDSANPGEILKEKSSF